LRHHPRIGEPAFGDECRAQVCDADFRFETVFPQALRQHTHCPIFFEADFRIVRDLIAQGEHFSVH
jgi:hypothetical protein